MSEAAGIGTPLVPLLEAESGVSVLSVDQNVTLVCESVAGKVRGFTYSAASCGSYGLPSLLVKVRNGLVQGLAGPKPCFSPAAVP